MGGGRGREIQGVRRRVQFDSPSLNGRGYGAGDSRGSGAAFNLIPPPLMGGGRGRVIKISQNTFDTPLIVMAKCQHP
jgi:hypothetical protein